MPDAPSTEPVIVTEPPEWIDPPQVIPDPGAPGSAGLNLKKQESEPIGESRVVKIKIGAQESKQ